MTLSTRSFGLALPVLVLVSCAGGEEGDPPPGGEVPAAVPTEALVRTADPYARGYTDDDFPRLQELAPGVYSYEQLRSAGEERFTTVSLFVVGLDHVLVADGQGSVEETARMLEHIARVTDLPVRTVVVGSDHGDHTAGNSAFPADVTFLAHPISAAALAAAAAAPNRASDAPPVRVPTELVEDRRVLQLGDREVHVLFLGRAHTGGDLVVYLPAERILFMSETYLHRIFPAMRSAYPSEWIGMLDRALGMDVETYVPGHGFVDAPEILREELVRYRDAVRTVVDEATRLHREGVPLEQAQEQARFGELESWTLRSSQAARAVQQVYAELNGELPGAVR